MAIAIGLAAALSLVAVPSASAYGKTAEWQVAVSINCNNPNPTICGGGGSGEWIWGEFDSVGGSATITGCGHSGGPALGLTPPFGGAGHMNVDVLSWTIDPGSGNFVILGEVDTFVGHGAPVSVTFSPEHVDTGIPAAPGHYALHPYPGESTTIQVVEL